LTTYSKNTERKERGRDITYFYASVPKINPFVVLPYNLKCRTRLDR